MHIARVLCAFVPFAAGAQNRWNSQLQVNPPSFDRTYLPTEHSIENDAISDRASAAANRNADVNVSEIEMGIEATVQAEIPPVLEQATFAPFPAGFTAVLSAPLQERSPRAASVTVGELAVPGKAHRALQKAAEAFRKGHCEESRDEITKALAVWPRYSDALVLSALLYLHKKEHSPALAAAQEAIAVDGTNGMAYIVLASAHNFAGQYDDALRALGNAVRFRPDAWQAYFERARAEMGKGDGRSALINAQRAGEIAPAKTSVIHYLKGAALLNVNRRSEAVLEFQIYLRTNPAGEAADRARLMIERSISQR